MSSSPTSSVSQCLDASHFISLGVGADDLVQQAGSLLLSGKYLIDGHSRGKNLTAALDNTDIESIKKFWNLTDSPVVKVTSPAQPTPALSVGVVCTCAPIKTERR
jgi:hypothetical protein